MKIRVTHNRYADGGLVLAPLGELRRRGLDPATKGGMTVASLIDDEGAVVAVERAFCNDRDNFCRRIGRDIAVGRLKKRCELQ